MKPAHFCVTADAPDNCYGCGAQAVVTVAIEEEGRLPDGPVEAWVDDGWTNVVWRRQIDMAQEPTFAIELTRTTPGTLRIHLRGKGMCDRLDRVVFGIEEIRPLTPCPDDFEEYWKRERLRLSRMPDGMTKELVPQLCTAEYDCFFVSVSTFDAGSIHGILTVPKGEGKYPVCVTVPGAGAGQIAPQNGLASRRWVTLTMNIHGFPIASTEQEQKARFDAWRDALSKRSGEPTYQRYGFAEGRDLPIYHNSILGMTRMLDCLSVEPYADARRFFYRGGSQGGGYGLYLTSLWGRFAKSLIYFPNMCDMLAYRRGRQPGSEHIMDQTPQHRPAAEQNGPYYDACNFAKLIHSPIRMVHGLSDDNCHTEGGIAAFNSIASQDKKLLLLPGVGHRWVKTDFEQWLLEF